MGKSILVTGVSGSGKSLICEQLNSLGAIVVDADKDPEEVAKNIIEVITTKK